MAPAVPPACRVTLVPAVIAPLVVMVPPPVSETDPALAEIGERAVIAPPLDTETPGAAVNAFRVRRAVALSVMPIALVPADAVIAVALVLKAVMLPRVDRMIALAET